MNTQYYDFRHKLNEAELDEIIEAYKEGEVLAFPTETVYGLGADIFNEEAIARIYQAKKRPQDNPLIAHIGNEAALEKLALEIPETARTLMSVFWPGPLTIILKKKPEISSAATAGLPSIGIRMPDHPVIESILVKGGLILVAPSANLSGSPSPTDMEHVREDLDGRVYGIIDGGPCEEGIESTIIDCTVSPPMILRPGTITREAIEEEIGPVDLDPSLLGEEVLVARAPGMKYKHYAPKATTYIIGDKERLSLIEEEMKRGSLDPSRTALILFEENLEHYAPLETGFKMPIGSHSSLKHAIRNLYRILRDCDILGIETIFIEASKEEGLGFSYMNRLKKAAGFNYLKKEQDF